MSDRPTLFVQWKGTDLCGDFHCTCGQNAHIHADFCYTIQCGQCGRVWDVPHTLTLTPSTETQPHVTTDGEKGYR